MKTSQTLLFVLLLFVMWLFVLCALAAAAAVADLPERLAVDRPVLHFGGNPAKAVVDTFDLMGPGGMYPYRGDFETASPRPEGEGLLTDGWTSVDVTQPANHWHVDTWNNPGSGRGAWCGSLAFLSCGPGDVAGGYGNNWNDILEFRKTVAGAATVRVQASLRYDTEPAYDYITLRRRTAPAPNFEPIYTGQSLAWDGIGTISVDHTFTYTAAELLGGTDIAVAFVFNADGAFSDEDCFWPTAGAAVVDDITVTLNDGAVTTWHEDFEDNDLGPDWRATPNVGVGDFARVWHNLGDLDACATNYTNQVAFIDDGYVVPGLPHILGLPGNDYGPFGYIVNNTGGLLGPTSGGHLQNEIRSPVMSLPAGQQGLTLAFDVYVHELVIPNDSPGIFYTWSVRSTAGGDIELAQWRDRNFVYFGGPEYRRVVLPVDDLMEPGATAAQVSLGAYELGWAFGLGNGTNGTPAPYFDNVSVKVYPAGGPRIVARESSLANDGFPASGAVSTQDLAANSVRFDMAMNIAPSQHLRNDPGDSITVDVTPRSGGTLDLPVMHWTLARRNPVYDAYRSLPSNPVTGRQTRTSNGVLVANRYNFDLPDTGMLYPGDVLQYYIAATDHVGGDARTATVPADLAAFGNPAPQAYPAAFTVRCLPSGSGGSPHVLLWNDGGLDGASAAWVASLTQMCAREGLEYDLFSTHAPASGVGNGLGGRATLSQLAAYDVILYTSGELISPTLSNGDFARDPGNDLGLLSAWLDLGPRQLMLTGDDLANSLYGAGIAGQGFLANRMGVIYGSPDIRDYIGGQVSPLVVGAAGNPVFGAASWVAYGGCPGLNDFDRVTAAPTAVRLAQFTAPGGGTTPYPYAAATLMLTGMSRVVSLNHDFQFVASPLHGPDNPTARTNLLVDVLQYFNAMIGCWGDVPPSGGHFSVAGYPNPFNPAITLSYTLARPGQVTMKVYDARGALVRTLLDGPVAEATGVVVWDGVDANGKGVSSGLYFVETRADGQVDVRKVTMLK